MAREEEEEEEDYLSLSRPRWSRVTCLPQGPRFTCSNPAEVDGFFQNVKILSTSPPGGTVSWGSRV